MKITPKKIFVAFCLIMLAVLVLMGCDSPSKTIAIKDETSPIISVTDYTDYKKGGYGRLLTVKHDDHLWVTEGQSQKGGFVHHPDCPCGKK